MPIIINRGRAVAAVVTAAHREELMQMKRENASVKMIQTEKPTLNKLKESSSKL